MQQSCRWAAACHCHLWAAQFELMLCWSFDIFCHGNVKLAIWVQLKPNEMRSPENWCSVCCCSQNATQPCNPYHPNPGAGCCAFSQDPATAESPMQLFGSLTNCIAPSKELASCHCPVASAVSNKLLKVTGSNWSWLEPGLRDGYLRWHKWNIVVFWKVQGLS